MDRCKRCELKQEIEEILIQVDYYNPNPNRPPMPQWAMMELESLEADLFAKYPYHTDKEFDLGL
jgi:hypothetical protein